ncbi:hypothetical protein [Phnomibacter ginsenosidimutans]|uniref:Uncharacterized protein n=1 Tax=Phnomibacter ginsenosidimutans TaxID=2676868 RepID=A0A6I6GGT3_9BACT|nr:hypothetical protein [Phnomibacter ginsenosidimutans]QGW26868.1 hypothetical protein GLV81_01030 [Phnomibacter ginsenosidimutans]
MKIIYTLLFATLLMACGGSKSIYEDKNITEKKLEKLIREYSANPSDKYIADQVKFAYDYLHNQYQAGITQYQYSSTLEGKESLLGYYINLQSFYDRIRGYSTVSNLLKPGTVGAEIEKTKLELVSGYYEQAAEWMDDNNWRSARRAYRSLTKVQQWMPDYKNTRQLMRQAKEQGIINAVILPLSAEGFYYNNRYGNNNFGNNNMGSTPRLSEQLVNDLGGSYNSGGWYRVYNSWDVQRQNVRPNWTMQPVWTQLQMDNPRSNRYDRTVEKQAEIGKDTAGRPIYKKLTATLTVTEVTYTATGRLELRIMDDDNNERISNRSFHENYSFKTSWATYKGDAGALSNQDWELINAPRNSNNRDEELMEQRLIEKMYQNILSHLRGQLNN